MEWKPARWPCRRRADEGQAGAEARALQQEPRVPDAARLALIWKFISRVGRACYPLSPGSLWRR
jgi:hypothetical protein